MTGTLKARIEDDVRAAMRARDRERLGALRQVTAAIKQREVDSRAGGARADLDDAAVLAVLEKMLKQRRESLAQYRAAGREDLAEREAFEIGVIEAYLPEPLDEAEIAALVDAAVAETGAAGPRDMGRVMAAIRPRVAGRADMARVSALVKARLAGG